MMGSYLVAAFVGYAAGRSGVIERAALAFWSKVRGLLGS